MAPPPYSCALFIAQFCPRSGLRRTAANLHECSVTGETSLSFGERPLTSCPLLDPGRDCLPADFTCHSESGYFCHLMATLTGFFRYTRVSPLQGAAHCLALPPVVPTCRGGSAWLLRPALRRRRERLLLRPEVPYLFERFASCRPLHLAVSASPGPSRGAGRYPRQVSLSVQALRAGRLEVLTDFMHRGDRGQNSTMKLSRSFSCGAVPLPRFVIVS